MEFPAGFQKLFVTLCAEAAYAAEQDSEQEEITEVHKILVLGFHLSSKDKLFVRNYPYLFLNSYYICGKFGEIRKNQLYNISIWNIISEKLKKMAAEMGGPKDL